MTAVYSCFVELVVSLSVMDERRKQRALELAEKKKKLEELKKKRAQRKNNSASAAVAAAVPNSGGGSHRDDDVNSLVDALLQAPSPMTAEKSPPAPVPALVPLPVPTPKVRPVCQRCSRVCVLDLPPSREKITYTKGAQTDPISIIADDPLNEESTNVLPPVAPPPLLSPRASPRERRRSRSGSVDSGGRASPLSLNASQEHVPSMEPLTEDECHEIVDSAPFLSFFRRSTRVCERALADTRDWTLVYGGDAGESELMGEATSVLEEEHPDALYDERWCAHRAVADIHWSNQYKELFLAAMAPMASKSHSSPSAHGSMNDPDGVVLLWSLHRPATPEFVLKTQSTVTCAIFDPFSTNLVLGGSYSGQMVLWDMRAGHHPIQRSALSSDGHTHPVYCASIVGSTNNHEIVSMSTDGLLCTWNKNQLDKPLEQVMLKRENRSVAPTSTHILDEDNNTFVCGGEDGGVYLSQVHRNKGGEALVRAEGHFGPITDLSMGSSGILTSSMDWTIKSWKYTPNAKMPLVAQHTFSGFSDCVYSAQWCPAHPNMFCAAGGEGALELWDMDANMETPVFKKQLGEGALNKVRWSMDSSRIAAGGVSGRVSMFKLSV